MNLKGLIVRDGQVYSEFGKDRWHQELDLIESGLFKASLADRKNILKKFVMAALKFGNCDHD